MNISHRQGQSHSAHHVYVGPLHLVFSYDTVVAFAVDGQWIVSENVWSKTTGKHISQETPDGVPRVPFPEFERRLDDVLARLQFGVTMAPAVTR